MKETKSVLLNWIASSFASIVTGLRSGELCSLKFSDLSEKKLMVARTQTRHKNEGDYDYVIREETKGRDGRRYIAIPPVVHTIIDRIRSLNPDGEYMFVSPATGKRMKAESFSDKLEKICKYIDIPVKRLHKMRRTYASMLLDAGIPESIITNQMGHTDIATTRGITTWIAIRMTRGGSGFRSPETPGRTDRIRLLRTKCTKNQRGEKPVAA